MRATAPIRDFTVGIYDGPHATPKPSNAGPVFLGIKNVTVDGRLDLENIRHVSETEFPRWTRRIKPQEHDRFLEGTKLRYIATPTRWFRRVWATNGSCSADRRKVDPRFALLLSFARLARAITISGATVNRIPLTRFPDTATVGLRHNFAQPRVDDPLRRLDRKSARARVIDFDNDNRFLGRASPDPHDRRVDLVCFVNGLPLVVIELKAVYRNIREASTATSPLDENVIAHAFHHNAFLIVSNGDRARYGSITSGWEHFAEWKRLGQGQPGAVMLNGMLAHIGCSTSSRTSSCSTRASRAPPEGHCAKPPSARRQPGGGVGGATGGAEARIPAGAAPEPSRRGAADQIACARGGSAGPAEGRRASRALHSRGAGRHRRAGASRARTARRVLAHPGERQVLFHGLLRGEGAAEAGRQLHVPADDRQERSRRPDLRDLHRLWCRRRQHAPGRIGRRPGEAAEGEPPLRLQPHPQVQQGCRSEAALQRARRHHRDLRRGAPHTGGPAGAQHAPRAAERGVHRLHRHAAVQAGPAHEAHLREVRLALRLQAIRRGRRHRQAGLREPGREAGRGAARSERPHRGEDRGGRARPRPGGAAGEAAGSGLRGHHRGRTA